MSNPKKFNCRAPMNRATTATSSATNHRTSSEDTPHPDAKIQRAKDFIKLLQNADERSRSIERNPGLRRRDSQN